MGGGVGGVEVCYKGFEVGGSHVVVGVWRGTAKIRFGAEAEESKMRICL